MTVTPTAPDRRFRQADFSTVTEALDYAAQGETGINLYGLRGELLLVLPYATLREEARALACRMLASGLKAGDRVGLIADTTPDFVRAFFACQYARLQPAPMPLPTPLGGKEAYVAQITGMLQSAQAAGVFCGKDLTQWIAQAATDAGCTLAIHTIDELPETGACDLPAPTPAETCYIQFSSGSTRNPAGVIATHAAVMANALAITRDGLKCVPSDRAVSWLPLYHDMGLVGFLLSPMAVQMSLDLLPTGAFVRRPLLWVDLMSRNGGTVTYSPTFGFELAARRAETAAIDHLDLSKVRVAGSGGDMVRAAPLKAFADRFGPQGFSPAAYAPSYGMAEATLALTMTDPGSGLKVETLDVDALENGQATDAGDAARQRSFVRCGPILPGHELEVRDETGKVLSERQVGRVFVRGPSLMTGYYNNPEATAAVLSADGWLDTGDLGFLIEGELVPTGRAKDLILLNGRNVWPQDLEWTAELETESLRSGDVAAFSVPQGDDEALVVLVQARGSDKEKRAKLIEDVATVLRARHGVDARVQLVGAHALPQTSSGKLSRSKAKLMYLAGQFAVEPA